MAAPKFKIGDKVKCMVAKIGGRITEEYMPVWNIGRKTGGLIEKTEKWVNGIVINSTENVVLTRFEHNVDKLIWIWPYVGHEDYSESQWQREGWLQLVDAFKPECVSPNVVKCSCTLDTIMSSGCRCGAFHSEQKVKGKL